MLFALFFDVCGNFVDVRVYNYHLPSWAESVIRDQLGLGVSDRVVCEKEGRAVEGDCNGCLKF